MLIRYIKKLLSFIIQKAIIYTDITIHRRKIKNFLINLNIHINNIYDVGSNDGEYSLLFKKIFPKSKIFAFEPNLKICKNSIKKFKYFKNIKVFNVAVGNENKYVDLKFDQNSSLTTSLAIQNTKSKTFKIKKFLYGQQKNKKKKLN